MSARLLYGAIEAGGTKFVCAVGNEQGDILDEARIETRDPATTLAAVCRYFAALEASFGTLTSLGVASFGPLDLNPVSPTFGYITSTPKAGWANTDLAGTLERHLNLPVFLDTDVNGAALGEVRWGTGRLLQSVAYVTVGTGIGAGIVHGGRAVHGMMHPEIGHIAVRRHRDDGAFAGICPYHHDCLEGMASGAAIVARSGRALDDTAAADPIWAIEADYLGQLCALLVLTHSPQRILMGGGVMREALFAPIHAHMLRGLRGYIGAAELQEPTYVAPPGLGTLAGIKGALSLAVGGGVLRSV